MRDYSKADRWTKTHIGHFQKKRRFVHWDVAVGHWTPKLTRRGKRVPEIYVKWLNGAIVRRTPY
jgi:hypothetical protein